MKRSRPPRRRTYLKASRRPIAPRRADPTHRAFAKRRCEPFRLWIRDQPCSVTHCVTGDYVRVRDATDWQCVIVDPAHIKTRKTGGDDLFNVIPLAHHLHEKQHRLGWPAFQKEYGIDAKQIATDLTETWLRTADGLAWRDAHPTNEDV